MRELVSNRRDVNASGATHASAALVSAGPSASATDGNAGSAGSERHGRAAMFTAALEREHSVRAGAAVTAVLVCDDREQVRQALAQALAEVAGLSRIDCVTHAESNRQDLWMKVF